MRTEDEVLAPRPSVGGLVARVGQALPWRRSPVVLSSGQAPANTANTSAAPGAAAPPRRKSEMGRLLIGMLAYIVGSYLIQYLLVLVNGLWGLHLERTQNLFPASWPLVGQMSRYSLIYLMLLIALIWLLYRTNIIPRDLFGVRRAAEQRNAAAAPTVTTGRRRSARRSATSTTTTSHTTTSARRAAAAHAPATSGTHDLEYGRVRALQRARRRKR